MARLIAFEARGIQRWIFAGGRLKDLAGGSETVETLAGKVLATTLAACGVAMEGGRPAVGAGRLLLAAAGRFRLVLEDEDAADRLVRLWPLVMAEAAPGLPFAMAACPYDGDHALAKIERELGGKCGIEQPELPLATPLTLRTQRTGAPAVSIDGDEAIDASMRMRRFLNPRNGLVERFGLPPGTRFVTETQRIAAAGGGNSVAMVQIDGNRMGSVARELASRAHLDGGRDYETFSEILRASTQAAAAAALAAVMPVDGGEIAARPIVLGGDDLGIVLPPAVALDFVCRFLDRFEKETEARLAEARSTEDVLKGVPTRFSAGAGIAWAHSHYPFDQAHGMAGSLCHWAKESLHAADGDTRMPPSAVAFFRLTSSMVSEFDTVLANELSEGGRTLTMGPYVLGDPPKGLATLKQLQDLCRAAARMPGGSWRKLVSAAHQGQLATKNHLRRMVETAADKDKAAQELRQALADMGCGDSEGVSGFDRAGRTPILDVETLQAVGAWGREDA